MPTPRSATSVEGMNTTPQNQTSDPYASPPRAQQPYGPPPPYMHAATNGPAPTAPRNSGWSTEGLLGRVLAVAGVAVTLLGVVMMLLVAAAAGLLTPPVRVGGGVALSLALLAGGHLLMHRDGGRVGGIALSATGIGGLYILDVAATLAYGWLPWWLGLAVATVIGVGGVALAWAWRTEVLATLVVACVGPLVLYMGYGEDAVVTMLLLVLLQAVACVPEAVKGWASLTVPRTLAPVVCAHLLLIHRSLDTVTVLAACAVAAVGLCTVLATSRRGDNPVQSVMHFVATTPFLTALALLDGWVTLAAAVALALVTLLPMVVLRPVGTSLEVSGGAVTALALGVAAHELVPVRWYAVVLFLVALVFAVTAYSARSKAHLVISGVAGGLAPVCAFGPYGSPMLAVGVLMTAWVVVFGTALVQRFGADLDATVVLGSLGLWVSLTLTGQGLGELFGGAGGEISVVTTLLWVVAGLAVLFLGLKLVERPESTAVCGMTFVGAALAKLFLIDLAGTGDMVRAATVLLTGLCLLGGGALYGAAFKKRKHELRARQAPVRPMAPQQPNLPVG